MNISLRFSLSLIFLFISSCLFHMYGQVTVGLGSPPEKGALLQLKDQEADHKNRTSTKGGLLLPRVELESRSSLKPIISDSDPDLPTIKESHIGLMVYNLASTPSSETDPLKILKPGIYTWEGSQWAMYIDNTYSSDVQYFYMPSFNLPISSVGNGKTFNLYSEYVKQFQKQEDSTIWVSSNSNLSQVSKIYTADELDYVVTGMLNEDVIKINSISSQGVLNYNVLKTEADPEFFINIILVVK